MSYARYTLVFLLIVAATGFAVAALNAQADTRLGSSAQLMVPAMVAAAIEGQRFARAHQRRPETGTAWTFTWFATAVAVVLNVGLAFLAGGLLPEFGRLAIAAPLSQQFLLLLAFYAGGYVICNRLFLGIGVSTELSRQARDK